MAAQGSQEVNENEGRPFAGMEGNGQNEVRVHVDRKTLENMLSGIQ